MATEDAATQALNRMRKSTAAQTRALQEQTEAYVQEAMKAELVLQKSTADYVECGVAYNSLEFQTALSIMGVGPSFCKDYFRALAAERCRPFIYAVDTAATGWIGGHYRNEPYTQLTVPASARLKGVVAGLTLVARNGEVWDHEVTTAHSERLWRFNFSGNGIYVFNTFRKTCCENRVMRIILRLGPSTLPTEVTP